MGLFNLEEEEGEGLTHYGQSLGDMERFDDIQISEGEEEEGRATRRLAYWLSFFTS